MSKSSKTTSNQQTHTVTTPTNPDWVTNSVQSLSGDIGKLGAIDPYSLVSGPNALQQQAATGAAGLGIDPAQWAKLTTGDGPQGAYASLLDGLGSYMSPYTDNVVNTSLAGYDQNAGMTRAQDALDIGNSNAWGGSGASIKQALTSGQLAMGRGQLEAGLRDQAFNTGASLSNMDAARRQDASFRNAELSQGTTAQRLQALLAGDANARSNVLTQAGLGTDLRNITQQQLNAPISLLQARTGLTQGLPYNLFTGQTSDGTSNSTSTTKSSDPLGSLGTLAMLAAAPFTGGASLLGAGLGGLGAAAAAGTAGLAGLGGSIAGGLGSLGAIASDGRIKTDVQTVGYDAKGRRWVDFRYRGHKDVHRGVIAQEVMLTDPDAVSVAPQGWLQVDYGMLEAA